MNIAERKEAEAQLRMQAQQLMEADRRKDTFLAVLGTSCEIRWRPSTMWLIYRNVNPTPSRRHCASGNGRAAAAGDLPNPRR